MSSRQKSQEQKQGEPYYLGWSNLMMGYTTNQAMHFHLCFWFCGWSRIIASHKFDHFCSFDSGVSTIQTKNEWYFLKLPFHLKFEHPIIQTIIFTLGHSFWGLYLTVNLPRECFWWVTHGTTGVPELREMALLVETWLKWSSNFDPYTLFIHVYTNMCIHVYSVHITSTNTAV